MKLMIGIGVTLGSMLGSWLGSLLDGGSMIGLWGIVLGGVGGIAGILLGYKIGNNYLS